ncbi:hypothetical protein LIER_26738 [Lithospermum erythrorhizon]|uniref:Formin-like protein n=1 Tax=Lithospermum erythrorhizon TaxID=34254 RepID=A0AAV3RCN3_LITER
MRAYHIAIIFIILNSCSIAQLLSDADTAEQRQRDSVGKGRKPRRILHEPLLPAASPPPLVIESSPLPRPPPAHQDQPFFPEVPGGNIPDQPQQLPSSPPANGLPVSNNSIVTEQAQQAKPIKKVAIAISVGIVTLGMLSALAFYLFKHRVNHPREPQKLVGNNNSQRRINEESGGQPSSFLYIGTVEQSNQESVNGNNGPGDGSTYQRPSTAKVSDRYRPSPDLQPLAPLPKNPPGLGINSPPPMSTSDDESHDSNAFYTPRSLSVSSEDGFYTPMRQQSYRGNSGNTNTGLVQQSKSERISSSPVHHSKRTSPKTRLVAPPPNVKPTMVPSIQQPPGLPPLPPRQLADSLEAESLEPHEQGSDLPLPFVAKRLKFSAPPPPPDMTRFLSTNNQNQQPSEICIPTPPPPPPPSRKLGVQKINVNSEISQKRNKAQSADSPNPRTTPENSKQHYVEEVINEASSSDIHVDDDDDGSRPKLKPLHWDKVKASSDRATVWDQLKSNSFQLNEDMMDSLFISNSTNSVKLEYTKKHGIPSGEKEIRLLDPKKSQNIAIFLRALNVSQDEVHEALLEGNHDGLGLELLETLVKMAPTKEEEIKLTDYSGDLSKLGSAERFLKAILDVPFAFTRVDAMLYRKNFDTEVRYLRDSYNTLEEACTELKNSRLFLKLLEAVLRTGNRMNVGTMRGDARAFKLDTLLKLVDIKGTDGKTTLLHFVVQAIIRSEQTSCNPPNEAFPSKTNIEVKEEAFKKEGLQIVSGLAKELSNIKKAAGMDSDVLHGYLNKLNSGLHKVKTILQNEKQSLSGKFFESTKMFVEESEQDICRIKAEEKKALSMVREVTEYFHGDTAKEEAHPFRIFVIVRDFLSILDNVCREVGKMQERTIVGSARSFNLNAYR